MDYQRPIDRPTQPIIPPAGVTKNVAHDLDSVRLPRLAPLLPPLLVGGWPSVGAAQMLTRHPAFFASGQRR
jgi:hypothetical protein